MEDKEGFSCGSKVKMFLKESGINFITFTFFTHETYNIFCGFYLTASIEGTNKYFFNSKVESSNAVCRFLELY